MKRIICLIASAVLAAAQLSAAGGAGGASEGDPHLLREIALQPAPHRRRQARHARGGLRREGRGREILRDRFRSQAGRGHGRGVPRHRGVINTTSVLLAAAGGNELKIVSGFSRPTGLFAIVVKDPAIRSIADLKGRKVAGPKGTVLHQLLAAALDRSGLSMGDVDFLQMDIPAARTALLVRPGGRRPPRRR